MGLDTTHDAWHGPYSAFSRLRNTLAEAAGYQVKDYEYADGWTGRSAQVVAEGDWAVENYAGEWNGHPPEDPLLILLVHSDCDGQIEADHCRFLAVRLRQIVEAGLPDGPERDRWIEAALEFADGCDLAASNGEPLEFR